jgi:hypothetical protein
MGLVLPSGAATDHGSAGLRRELLDRCEIDALVGFDNRLGVFPIHRSVRFVLLTATAGSRTRSMACRLGEHDPESLDRLGDEPANTSTWFPVRLTPAVVRHLSGEGLAIPELRLPIDLAIAERAASLYPPLGSGGGDSGWGARFARELNVSDDRAHFKPAAGGWPVIEGKHLGPFRLRDLEGCRTIAPDGARRLLSDNWQPRPRLAYRDVASATNRLTLIAALLPARCVSVHTVFCLRTRLPPASQHFLAGLFNSFVVNYLVRMRVTTHVTAALVQQLPIPRPHDSPRAFRLVSALARTLARRSHPDLLARLHAIVAGLYQLSDVEFAHVLDTFPLIPQEERDRARQAYAALER